MINEDASVRSTNLHEFPRAVELYVNAMGSRLTAA